MKIKLKFVSFTQATRGQKYGIVNPVALTVQRPAKDKCPAIHGEICYFGVKPIKGP